MIKIEHNIPIPITRSISRGAPYSKYPVGELEVGDSFAIQVWDVKEANRVRSALTEAARRFDIMVTTRQIANGKGKRWPCILRVWRTK